MVLEVVFINVYKHRGCWIQDPRSKILGKTSWIQGLDPRSKIQDSRKNFLDPRSGSKIQDPRFQEKLLGSKVWIQDPRSKILGKTSWIQGLDPRSKIQDSRKNFLNPQRNLASDLGKLCLRIQVDPDLGSKKFFLESWILDLGSRPWIQEVLPRILDLGSWIQTLDPRSFFCRSIVFINVYKHLETCQTPPCPEKGFREGPKYWKIQISPHPSHV